MTTTEQPLDLARLARAEALLQERRRRSTQIEALEASPQQQEALQWSRVDFAAAAAATFRERVRVFDRLGTSSLGTPDFDDAMA